MRTPLFLLFTLLIGLHAPLRSQDDAGGPHKGSDSKQKAVGDDEKKRDVRVESKPKHRRVAIGDIHGDVRRFRKLLRDVKLIDAKDRWIAGKQHFVQTGDIVDRGAGSREAIELLRRLQKEAAKVGGGVTVLLGNHEVMNLTGDMRYVHPGEYAAFAKDESASFRKKRKKEVLSLVEKGSDLLRSQYYASLKRHLNAQNIDRNFPAGYFAHRREFSSQGSIGKWLLGLDFATKADGTLFVHAGISPRFSKMSVDQINRRMKSELRLFMSTVEELEKKKVFDSALGFGELFLLVRSERQAGGPHPSIAPLFQRLEQLNTDSLLLSVDGPIWYRGLAENDEMAFEMDVDEILEQQGVDRIVIGHTQPRSLRVQGRFGNSVILIDTGMNHDHYKGRPSALLLQPNGAVQVFE